MGGAFQPGDALIQDGDLGGKCGYIGKPRECLRYLVLSVYPVSYTHLTLPTSDLV